MPRREPLAPRSPVLAHFERRFFEVYGLAYYWDEIGAYWLKKPGRSTFLVPHVTSNERHLALLERLSAGFLVDACARIDRVFANPHLRASGVSLGIVALWWDEAQSDSALTAAIRTFNAPERRQGAA